MLMTCEWDPRRQAALLVLAFLCFVLIAVGGVNRLNGNLPQNTSDTLK